MPQSQVIRAAVQTDCGEIARLASQLGYPAGEERMRLRLKRLLASPTDLVLVAQASDEVLAGWIHGFLSQMVESDYRIEIGGLVIDEKLRGQGIGTDLVRRVESWGISHGALQISVRCRTERCEAHSFYEGLGYSRAKTQIVFRKPLG